MESLKERILRKGRNLGHGILKVDGFINHQVDPQLMLEAGQRLAERFRSARPTKVLTAEISGIAPALTTALALGIPVVYARKSKPITMPDAVFLTTAPSHTKGREVELIISPEYLGPGERVLIIDDFLATGQTIAALVRLAVAAGATVVGIGAVIEKTFEGGRELLSGLGVPIESLAMITDMSGGRIVFADEAAPAEIKEGQAEVRSHDGQCA
ncbi:MAG: xanthine phosphoribosyltransferase [Chloroflexota bacterium]